jgi:hypothetical protein
MAALGFPDAVQRSSRCYAEPGPTSFAERWTPDQPHQAEERRAAQHPGNELLLLFTDQPG